MSEIPIGSPPAPPGRHAAPPGWYSDPLDRAKERYWDGWQWSRTTRVSEHPQVQQPPVAGLGRPAPVGYPEHPRWTPSSAAGQAHRRPAGSGAGYGPSGGAVATADGVPLSGWGSRALAGLIDVIGIGLVGLAASLPFYLDFLRYLRGFWVLSLRASQQGLAAPVPPSAAELAQHLSGPDQFWAGLIASVIGVAYYALFWRFRSATLGQLACGLRVVPVDQGQGRPRLEWGTVIIRAMIWVLPAKLSYLILFWLLDCLSPLWSPKRQALHDRVAKTQVVRIR